MHRKQLFIVRGKWERHVDKTEITAVIKIIE
jgi:hypothetical protein